MPSRRPLSFDRFYGQEADRFVLRSITDEVMYEIMMLSGQEYVDEYASKVKADQAGSEERVVGRAAPDRQALPTEPEELSAHARRLDYASTEAFLRDYQHHTAEVNRIFERRFSQST